MGAGAGKRNRLGLIPTNGDGGQWSLSANLNLLQEKTSSYTLKGEEGKQEGNIFGGGPADQSISNHPI